MSLTIKGTPAQIKQMLEYYEGYLILNVNTHIIAKVRIENATITFYSTNTVLFQGVNEAIEYNIWAEKFSLPIAQHVETDLSRYESLKVIGCDEVGTGDYFGPIVVCSCYVHPDQVAELKRYGVKDSKLLTDDFIIDLALKIKNIVTHSILVLSPERFNALHKTDKDNMNFIKACLHHNAINSLIKKVNETPDAIIIDEFTPKDKYLHYLRKLPDVNESITMIPKAEMVHVGVAAASILARATFLKEMKDLGNTVKVSLLKGASQAVDRQAFAIAKSYGTNILSKIAKLKFANTQKMFDYADSLNYPLVDKRD